MAATLADYGFNCIKLSDDWQDADFLACHADGTTTLRVQLKSRLTIQKNYLGKDLWMAFPNKNKTVWYLIRHDELVDKVGATTKWLESRSWRKGHVYSSQNINRKLLPSLDENKLEPVYGVVLDEG